MKKWMKKQKKLNSIDKNNNNNNNKILFNNKINYHNKIENKFDNVISIEITLSNLFSILLL